MSMSIDEHFEAIRLAYKMAQDIGGNVYVTESPAGGADPGGPAISPTVFEDDVQLTVTPDGRVSFGCDACGLGLSPFERDEALRYRAPDLPMYPAAHLIV